MSQLSLLKTWHLKLALLGMIITPAITATGAYYGLQNKIQSDKAEITERVSKLELDSEKNFADKASLRSVDTRMQHMEVDLAEIKTLLKNRLR